MILFVPVSKWTSLPCLLQFQRDMIKHFVFLRARTIGDPQGKDSELCKAEEKEDRLAWREITRGRE